MAWFEEWNTKNISHQNVYELVSFSCTIKLTNKTRGDKFCCIIMSNTIWPFADIFMACMSGANFYRSVVAFLVWYFQTQSQSEIEIFIHKTTNSVSNKYTSQPTVNAADISSLSLHSLINRCPIFVKFFITQNFKQPKCIIFFKFCSRIFSN